MTLDKTFTNPGLTTKTLCELRQKVCAIIDEIEALEAGGGSGGVAVETDPTVPAWAKAATKPNYTASEVGAIPNTGTGVTTERIANGAVTSAKLASGVIPSVLPNPQPLTINGQVYDGSQAVNIEVNSTTYDNANGVSF